MNPVEVTRYLQATESVEGWFFPIDAHLFAALDEVQKQNGVAGNLFEIGVHHGKTALLLARMRRGEERLGVCDVFDRQDLNIDHSGEGSRHLFLSNVRKFGGISEEQLLVFAKRSEELTSEDTTTTCRFFHIDGGHLPADVFSDLTTADAAVLEQGVVAVDDVFNPNWPGVAEGFFEFIAGRPRTLVPILIGGNKIFLTRPSAAEMYERHWARPEECRQSLGSLPFTFEFKDWLGRRVLTAIRHAWVDLDPLAAARQHLTGRSWRERLLRRLL